MALRTQTLIYPIDQNGRHSLPQIDVSNDLLYNTAISPIRRSVDSSDFVVGVFSFDHCKIKLKNTRRKYSNTSYLRAMPFGSDGARVEIFTIRDATSGINPSPSIVTKIFTGTINDEATKESLLKEEIVFTVLSLDSILKRRPFLPEAVRQGITLEEALGALLSTPPIPEFIKLPPGNIDLDLKGLRISSRAPFQGKNSYDVVTNLLVASNSVMFVDENRIVHIAPRTPSILDRGAIFRGPYSSQGKNPAILSILDYNQGLHRMINRVNYTDTTGDRSSYEDRDYIDAYGIKEKTVDWSFLSIRDARDAAFNLVNKYRYPKSEITIKVKLDDARELNVLSIVGLDVPPLYSPTGKRVPEWGKTKWGEGKWPNVSGGGNIDIGQGWLVYEKIDDMASFETTLKLRTVGVRPGDQDNFVIPLYWGLGNWGEEDWG